MSRPPGEELEPDADDSPRVEAVRPVLTTQSPDAPDHNTDDNTGSIAHLTVVCEALAACLERGEWRAACAKILKVALSPAQSEYGFIGIVNAGSLHVLASDGLDWHRVNNLSLYGDAVRVDADSCHAEIRHFNNLCGRAITRGETVMVNLPEHEAHSAETAACYPPLHSFLAVPVFAGKRVLGVLALSNRPGGYTVGQRRNIEALVSHLGGLCTGYRKYAMAQMAERERVSAGTSLQTSDAQLRRIAGHAAHLGGWTIDLDTQQLLWSDEVCAIHDLPAGYTPTLEEGLGYFPPEVRGEVIRCIDACATHGTPYDLEVPKDTASGRRIWVRSIGEAVRDENGRIIRLQGAFQDISERRQALEALRESEDRLRQAQKMEAIGRLAGGIAHDFNNLLTVINGYSDNLLEQTGLDPRVLDSAQMINTAGTRAAALTRQLLSFSRQTILQPQILNLNGVVLETCNLLGRLIGEDIQFATVLDPDISCVRADPGQINQVLMNLVINARDAMPKGGKLTITTADIELDETFAAQHPGCKPGPYVTLTISDTGIGMTPEVQSVIFEPFFTTKEVGKGSGLGLAMVYGIVEQSRGWIGVTSAPGCGSTFRIYLPAVQEKVDLQADAAPQSQTRGKGSGTILLVEDEASVRDFLRTSLESHGYEVLTAVDGNDGLQVMQACGKTLDLVLTDMTMPNLGGADMVRQLKALFPRLKVLFMSGHIDASVLRDSQRETSAAFIQKPFPVSTLFEKVRQVLEA